MAIQTITESCHTYCSRTFSLPCQHARQHAGLFVIRSRPHWMRLQGASWIRNGAESRPRIGERPITKGSPTYVDVDGNQEEGQQGKCQRRNCDRRCQFCGFRWIRISTSQRVRQQRDHLRSHHVRPRTTGYFVKFGGCIVHWLQHA